MSLQSSSTLEVDTFIPAAVSLTLNPAKFRVFITWAFRALPGTRRSIGRASYSRPKRSSFSGRFFNRHGNAKRVTGFVRCNVVNGGHLHFRMRIDPYAKV